jgi:Transcription factor WhiB
MSGKISIREAADKYRVTTRTIHRWVKQHKIKQLNDGSYDREELDNAVDNLTSKIEGYGDVDWDRAGCKNLPTDFFYKIEERGVAKIVDHGVFRFTCVPCPIWAECLGYATHNEDYGVWGGMTTEERKSLLDPNKWEIEAKVISDFSSYGITYQMIRKAIGK